MITHWHIPISGFTQTVGHPTGFDTLWQKLRRVTSPQCCLLHPQEWNADWRALAEFISRNSTPVPYICVYAYSWGCGHGAVKLAKELRKRNLVVQCMVLCDPVFHSWVRPWRALVFSPAIRIPDNVRRVEWFFQRQNKPQATTLVAQEPRVTAIGDGRELNCDHQHADDQNVFHLKCLELAAAYSELGE